MKLAWIAHYESGSDRGARTIKTTCNRLSSTLPLALHAPRLSSSRTMLCFKCAAGRPLHCYTASGGALTVASSSW